MVRTAYHLIMHDKCAALGYSTLDERKSKKAT